MTSQQRLKLERQFLEAVGFDLSYGYYQDDVDRLKSKYPDVYKEIFSN